MSSSVWQIYHVPFKIISVLLFTVPSKAIPLWKGQKLNFQIKKKCRLRKPITFRNKKHKGIFLHNYKKHKGIFLHNYFLQFFNSAILPGKLSILCNTVETYFLLQYLGKTERLASFYKFILWRCYIMQTRSELMSIVKLDTWTSPCGR